MRLGKMYLLASPPPAVIGVEPLEEPARRWVFRSSVRAHIAAHFDGVLIGG